MGLKLLFRKIKLRKIKQWENYLAFVKDVSNYGPEGEFRIMDDELIPVSDESALFTVLPEYEQIKEKCKIPLDGKTTVFEKALSVMQWLTDNTFYSGMQFRMLPDDTLTLLEFSCGNGFKCALNCRDKAIALTDLLLAHGIKAYPLCLLDTQKIDSHFVVHVYCEDINRWVVLDPSFNCYFTDDENNVLNIWSLRELKLKNKQANIVGYSFNGTDEAKDVYLKYFVNKQLARVSTWSDNSNKNRKTNNLKKRKEFNSRVPQTHI